MGSFGSLRPAARAFVCMVAVAGAASGVAAWIAGPPPLRFRTLLLVAFAVAGGLVRIPLPVVGRLSLAYPFLFGSLLAFGPGASVLAAVSSAAAAMSVPVAGRRPPLHRAVFNVGLVSLCAAASAWVYHRAGGTFGSVDPTRDLLPIAAYTACFPALNLGLIALATELAGEASARRSMIANVAWAIPGFLAGSSLAVVLGILLPRRNLAVVLLAAPIVYLLYLSYRVRLEKAQAGERHLRQTAELYQSVTRALARAIEAKDELTEDHLHRVQTLCLGIADQLRLSEEEREALRAAALLHDIGKIAVPEYILSKPGRLTPEELEAMRVHPEVGAEILGKVPFPYPLAPIVRHHHERWDGKGYPDRLAGTGIPLGARILTLVDCYDALTTDRPYRKAVPRAEAIDYLRREAGRIFDPTLVEVLAARIEELDRAARHGEGEAGRTAPPATPATEPAPVRGRSREPGSPAESAGPPRAPRAPEIPTLDAMRRIVDTRLELEDTLTLLAARLAKLVPHRTLVVYLFDDERRNLVARFATGAGAARLIGLSIPVGERPSGWAALHQRTHGDRAHLDPLERDGALSDLEELRGDGEIDALRSALVAPLTTEREQIGVLSLYDHSERVFDAEDRRLLAVATERFTEAIRHGRAPGAVDSIVLTDAATGVPNWRYFLLETRQRLSIPEGEAVSFGLIAFRIEGLGAIAEVHGVDGAGRLAGEIARRLARAGRPDESLVRVGTERFVISLAESRSRVVAARCLELLEVAQATPVELGPERRAQVRLRGVHLACPADGATAEELLRAIDDRLESGGDELPRAAFPRGRWTVSGVDA